MLKRHEVYTEIIGLGGTLSFEQTQDVLSGQKLEGWSHIWRNQGANGMGVLGGVMSCSKHKKTLVFTAFCVNFLQNHSPNDNLLKWYIWVLKCTKMKTSQLISPVVYTPGVDITAHECSPWNFESITWNFTCVAKDPQGGWVTTHFPHRHSMCMAFCSPFLQSSSSF